MDTTVTVGQVWKDKTPGYPSRMRLDVVVLAVDATHATVEPGGKDAYLADMGDPARVHLSRFGRDYVLA